MTAPVPAPAEWLRELMMQEYGVRFSPEGPMAATQACTLSLRQSASVAARVPRPHTPEASLMVTWSFLMFRYTGLLEAPSTTMAS